MKYIYLVKNLINGKIYVGFHSTNKDFSKDYYLGSGVLLKKAIKKYGRNNFIKGILEYVENYNWPGRETYWINKMKSHVNYGGYNLTYGGEGVLGFKHSNETKEKLKKSHKGKKLSKETKNKIGSSLRGNSNIGGWNKNLKWSEEVKEKIRTSNLGKKHTEKTKNKIREEKINLFKNKINHPRSKIWIVHTPTNKFLCIGTFRKFRDKNKANYNKYFKNSVLHDEKINGWYFKEFKSLEEIPNIHKYKEYK